MIKEWLKLLLIAQVIPARSLEGFALTQELPQLAQVSLMIPFQRTPDHNNNELEPEPADVKSDHNRSMEQRDENV